MADNPDPWGPYRATIEDHLDTCADYLSRLRRSLAGEIAPDRDYFSDKAHQPHSAARGMVRIVQDVDRWLGDCGATVEADDTDGRRYICECTLPAGHDGTHDDDGADRLVAGPITGELRDLADAVERVSEHFGRAAPDVDRELTRAPGTIANGYDSLANLTESLDTIRRRTAQLAGKVRVLDLEPDAVTPTRPSLRSVPHADPPLSAGL